MKKNNIFIVLIIFSLIFLTLTIVYNVYTIGANNNIKKEIDSTSNVLAEDMRNQYIKILSLYFKEQLIDETNQNKIIELNNFIKEYTSSISSSNFNNLKSSINDIIQLRNRNATYVLLFLAVFTFILGLIINLLTNNSKEKNNIQTTKKIVKEENEKIKEKPNIIISNEIDKKEIEIKNMYKVLVEEIKNAKEDNAMEILEKIFQIDDRNYLALNGAGILYTKIYTKNGNNTYFVKADKFYESAISIYNKNKDILNNKAILYSTKYGKDNNNTDYSTALNIFNNTISSYNNDFDIIHNKATLNLLNYKITANAASFDEALRDYNELLEINNHNIYALNNRSMLYFDKYKYTKDKKYFEKSIKDCNDAFSINSEESLESNGNPYYIYKF
ncbi:tetratricopeptide repeat protein [Brachyspira pilosicoli]|uniref:TPR domain-containing protein n=1 Tax=Brachyspira pilosicoli TaxID=52584 RepID=A0A5C8EGM2_BRAPL|nr:hypothetical protein [Brachyspira pilosicoli]TXJ35802.1 hypothetical protein EPJ72_12140 [Brachyspira pilosicoli]